MNWPVLFLFYSIYSFNTLYFVDLMSLFHFNLNSISFLTEGSSSVAVNVSFFRTFVLRETVKAAGGVM